MTRRLVVYFTEKNFMTDREINNRHQEICTSLAGRKLKTAFDQIEKMIGDYGLLVYRDEWQNLEQTYHYMLQYTVEGIQDPERQKIYRKLVVSAFELADKLYDSVKLKYSSSVEYEMKRTQQLLSPLVLKGLTESLEDYYLQQELMNLVSDVSVKTETKLEKDRKSTRLNSSHRT